MTIVDFWETFRFVRARTDVDGLLNTIFVIVVHLRKMVKDVMLRVDVIGLTTHFALMILVEDSKTTRFVPLNTTVVGMKVLLVFLVAHK
jgi:hypothetical protein